MRVLVTGGSGFIGGFIVNHLVSQGHQVLSFDLQVPYLYEAPEGCVFYQGDVRDGYTLARQVEQFGGIDAIIHLAGVLGTSSLLEREEYSVENNILTMLPVLRLARDLDVKIVSPMVANSWLNPYTITKKAAADFVQMFGQEYGVSYTLVRETHVYGPRQAIDERQKVLPTLIGCAILGQPLPLFLRGEQTVDLVHVDDVAESLIRVALNRDALNQKIVEFATGRLIKVKDVARMIIDIEGSSSELQLLGRRPGQTGEDDPYQDLGAIAQACGEWPMISLEDGLETTIAWYDAHFYEVGGAYLKQSTVGIA